MARQRIVLAAEEAEELSRRSRATIVSVRDRQRAEIILLSARGLTQQRIAEQLGISRLAVNRWVGRFALRRLAGLSDRGGRGRKPWLPQAAVQQVLQQAVTPPPHLGDGVATRWRAPPRSRRPACSACGLPVTSSRISRAPSNCPATSALKRSSGTSSGCISIRQTRRSCCAATRNHNARRWSARSRVCRWGSSTSAPRPMITCGTAR